MIMEVLHLDTPVNLLVEGNILVRIMIHIGKKYGDFCIIYWYPPENTHNDGDIEKPI